MRDDEFTRCRCVVCGGKGATRIPGYDPRNSLRQHADEKYLRRPSDFHFEMLRILDREHMDNGSPVRLRHY